MIQPKNSDPFKPSSRSCMIVVVGVVLGLLVLAFGQAIIGAQRDKTFMLKTGQIRDDGR